MDNFDLKKYLIENKLTKGSQLLKKDLSEEVADGKLFLYHRTKSSNLKSLASNNFKLTPGYGRVGNGTYFVYDSPAEIASGMDAYGGVSLRYSIPVSSLSNFLIFDPELQTKSLEQQLAPISDQINEILKKYIEDNNEYVSNPNAEPTPYQKNLTKLSTSPEYENNLLQLFINLYKQNKLKQLKFLEEISQDNILEDNFDGVLYSTKGNRGSMGNITGTDKTAVIYNQSLLKFEGVSTDGINYKTVTSPDEKLSVMSPEVSLKKGLTPPNTTIKKSLVNLKNAKNVTLPSGLKIVGSLDLRGIPNLVIPNDLEVKNTLYVYTDTKIPKTAKIGKVGVYVNPNDYDKFKEMFNKYKEENPNSKITLQRDFITWLEDIWFKENNYI